MSAEATVDNLIERVRFHSSESPNFVYIPLDYSKETSSTCRYFDQFDDGTTKCGCIMGYGLADLGFTAEDLQPYEGKDIGDVLYDLDIVTLAADGTLLNQIMWLCDVQSEQDCQTAWGRAVEIADRETWKTQ